MKVDVSTAFKKIPLDGESKGNPHPPTSTRLSQWSNRGPSIIWSYYDPEGSIKDTVSPEPDYYPKSTSDPAKGRSWYREIDHEEWRKAQKAPSIITTVTENVPSNLENEPSKAQIIPDSNEQMLHRAADSRESDTKIGGMDDPIPLNIFFNRESALTTSRHTHFKDSVGSRRENLHQPTTKRKSISFAKHVDAPVPTNFGSNGGSELSVLNEVIMLQHGQKNSIDSSTPSVVAERCGRILRFLPWHWKCFKRKKTKNTEGRSHSIRRSLVDNASTGLSVHEHRMKSSIY
ncbi:unnamed protein product [Acanthoscelides obtectus]|uniref:Uncharacterized protein n=1 Tax=Acanthoscelides obtectus TaxID=200917 RepID=A0A9P0P7E4_ACAOB|nr:unnamed protein product [Acanthoscelides obtectus]CAK1657665.1 hypothetical protein AOBTE_LOCUS20469 [Acanthoscelides obtectus]